MLVTCSSIVSAVKTKKVTSGFSDMRSAHCLLLLRGFQNGGESGRSAEEQVGLRHGENYAQF